MLRARALNRDRVSYADFYDLPPGVSRSLLDRGFLKGFDRVRDRSKRAGTSRYFAAHPRLFQLK